MTVAKELFCANTPTGATDISATSASPVMEHFGRNTAFRLMAYLLGSGRGAINCFVFSCRYEPVTSNRLSPAMSGDRILRATTTLGRRLEARVSQEPRLLQMPAAE